jgi:hypothetical protein
MTNIKGLKKAMSLPINMIIVVAIGFTLLILAIFWIKNFFGGLTQQTTEINRITQQAISSLSIEDPNAKFYLSKDMLTLSRGKVEPIAYYVQNFDNSDQQFYMAIQCVRSTSDPNFAKNCNPDDWFLKYMTTVTIKAKDIYKDALVVTAPKGTTPGNYVFNLYICKGSYSGSKAPTSCENGELYDQKTLIVEVK